jgi:C4-dicarboxylate transporter, DctM subunit
VWFGVVLVVLIEVGGITPPIGLNLFVIKGIAKHRPMSEVIAGSAPYAILMTIMIAIMTAFPKIVLWLPGHMMAAP